jgi:hypothetical protein
MHHFLLTFPILPHLGSISDYTRSNMNQEGDKMQSFNPGGSTMLIMNMGNERGILWKSGWVWDDLPQPSAAIFGRGGTIYLRKGAPHSSSSDS